MLSVAPVNGRSLRVQSIGGGFKKWKDPLLWTKVLRRAAKRSAEFCLKNVQVRLQV